MTVTSRWHKHTKAQEENREEREGPWGSTSFMIVFTRECDVSTERLAHPTMSSFTFGIVTLLFLFSLPFTVSLVARVKDNVGPSVCSPNCWCIVQHFKEHISTKLTGQRSLNQVFMLRVLKALSRQITPSGWEKHLSKTQGLFLMLVFIWHTLQQHFIEPKSKIWLAV